MSLDIVIPAHNEEQRIDRTLRAYRTGFPQADVRFLVALDGCDDHTSDVVRAHAADDERVVLHEFPKLGKGGVLMETFRRSDAELVAFVDADCATPPAELARMTLLAGDADGVIASRRLPASFTPCTRGRGRALTSSGFAWGVRHLFHLPLRRHAVRRQGHPPARRRAGRAADVVTRLPVRRRPARRGRPVGLPPRRGADGLDRPGRVEAECRGGRVAHVEERPAVVDPPPHDAGGAGVGCTGSGGGDGARCGADRRGIPRTARCPCCLSAVPTSPSSLRTRPPANATAATAASRRTPPTWPTASPSTGLAVEVIAPELDGDPAEFTDGPISVRRSFPMGRRALPVRAARRGGALRPRRAPAVRAVPLRRADARSSASCPPSVRPAAPSATPRS